MLMSLGQEDASLASTTLKVCTQLQDSGRNHASLQEPLSQLVISLDLYWTTCGMNSYQTSCALPAAKCPVINPQRPKLELVACIAFGLVSPYHPGIKRGLAIPAWQVWNLEGMRAGSPPPLVRNLKPFAANQKMPEAEITCIALHEASWPRITIAVGLATSQIYILRGSSGKPTWLGRLCYLHNAGAHDLIENLESLREQPLRAVCNGYNTHNDFTDC